ncbi:arginase family protein [Frondihabitans australicus]|uniref:Arginase n=1 Tax=Frondihabitans australicus TaxID=386892 RepID=A0A495IEJ4_9MICO|nr:arginase family protein [Frondihabitans australicus]RKR73781.1 arginase [Frondihabitans australicus]
MRLSEGANAIFGDLPAKASAMVEVPVGAGDGLGTAIHRLSSVAAVSNDLSRVLDESTEVALVVGGDCGVEFTAVRHALRDDTAVVWFDAHPDLNSPATSESGAFSGMVLGALLGRADGEFAAASLPAAAAGTPRLEPSRVVLAGARTYDDAEDAYIEEAGITTVSAFELDPAEVVEAVAATGASSVYIHVDLDVLDPSEFDGLLDPQPFGLAPATLVQTIQELRARFELVGAGLCSFAPATPEAAADDMGTILRIVGALAR